MLAACLTHASPSGQQFTLILEASGQYRRSIQNFIIKYQLKTADVQCFAANLPQVRNNARKGSNAAYGLQLKPSGAGRKPALD